MLKLVMLSTPGNPSTLVLPEDHPVSVVQTIISTLSLQLSGFKFRMRIRPVFLPCLMMSRRKTLSSNFHRKVDALITQVCYYRLFTTAGIPARSKLQLLRKHPFNDEWD